MLQMYMYQKINVQNDEPETNINWFVSERRWCYFLI